MVMPTIFTQQGGGINPSYDWFDFAAGAGYQKFYAVGGYDMSGAHYILTTQPLYSSASNNSSGALGTGTTAYNFDATFQQPVVVAAAPGYLSFYRSANLGGATNVISGSLIHVDNTGAETILGGAQSETQTGLTSTTQYMFKFNCSRLTIGSGEKLRLRINFSRSGNTSTLSWDLLNNNELKVYVPFAVDI